MRPACQILQFPLYLVAESNRTKVSTTPIVKREATSKIVTTRVTNHHPRIHSLSVNGANSRVVLSAIQDLRKLMIRFEYRRYITSLKRTIT